MSRHNLPRDLPLLADHLERHEISATLWIFNATAWCRTGDESTSLITLDLAVLPSQDREVRPRARRRPVAALSGKGLSTFDPAEAQGFAEAEREGTLRRRPATNAHPSQPPRSGWTHRILSWQRRRRKHAACDTKFTLKVFSTKPCVRNPVYRTSTVGTVKQIGTFFSVFQGGSLPLFHGSL